MSLYPWYSNVLSRDASYSTAVSTSPVSPATLCNFLFVVKFGESFLNSDGQEQKSFSVSSCWWISSPAFSFNF